MTETIHRTEAEIEALKANWRNDPCWDLETTEGFEAHVDTLRAYRLQDEAAWKAANEARLAARAEELGIPGNIALVQHIERLEWQIEQLRQELSRLTA
ncbi:MAG: hypothetical protein HC828_01960 [Blastochloris sp.]|nr:hypothetical protein [Blastochloris sp.]